MKSLRIFLFLALAIGIVTSNECVTNHKKQVAAKDQDTLEKMHRILEIDNVDELNQALYQFITMLKTGKLGLDGEWHRPVEQNPVICTECTTTRNAWIHFIEALEAKRAKEPNTKLTRLTNAVISIIIVKYNLAEYGVESPKEWRQR